jgi:hypothetical protein
MIGVCDAAWIGPQLAVGGWIRRTLAKHGYKALVDTELNQSITDDSIETLTIAHDFPVSVRQLLFLDPLEYLD